MGQFEDQLKEAHRASSERSATRAADAQDLRAAAEDLRTISSDLGALFSSESSLGIDGDSGDSAARRVAPCSVAIASLRD